PGRLNCLAVSFHERFEHTDELEDLEQAILYQVCAGELMPDGHSDAADIYHTLSHWLYVRFKRTQNLEDLEEVLSYRTRMVDLTIDDDSHADKIDRLQCLGGALRTHFERTKRLQDLDQLVSCFVRAVEITPDDHPQKPGLCDQLGDALRERFERSEQLEDIEKAVFWHTHAVELTLDSHPSKTIYLNSLGLSLRELFYRTWQLEYLDRAVLAFSRAVELRSDEDPRKPGVITNLANAFVSRSNFLKDVADLDQAIATLRHAVKIMQPGHRHMAPCLGSLGDALFDRFERTSRRADLDEAILFHGRLAELTREGEEYGSSGAAGLAKSLLTRFIYFREPEDLTKAITLYEKANALTPEGHRDNPRRLIGLANALRERHKVGHDQKHEDIHAAVSAIRQAVALTPDGHPELTLRLHELGHVLRERFRCTKTQEDFDATVQAFSRSIDEARIGVASQRFGSAMHCVEMHTAYPDFTSTEALLSAHARVIDFCSEFIWFGYGLHTRFEQSATVGENVTAAVAAACAAGSLESAVEWLETGRAVIWSQVLSLRAPLDELREVHPVLAGSLERVQLLLRDTTSTSFTRSDAPSSVPGPGVTVRTGLERHRQLVAEHDSLLKDIRSRAGFEDFLRPKRFEALLPPKSLVGSDTFVYLNVDASRCDALAIRRDVVSLIPLPDLTLKKASQLRELWLRRLRSSSIRERTTGALDELDRDGEAHLELSLDPSVPPVRASAVVETEKSLNRVPKLMWDWIVKPVLSALDMLKSNDGRLPHVIWCPTGPLAQLPLHTAGIYAEPDGPRVFNYIVSSYTPSLSALRSCYTGAAKRNSLPNALIVTQPASPGHSRLPNTTKEGTCVADIMRGAQLPSTHLNHDQATVAYVLGIIGQFPWVHLACHGSQRRNDPTQSAFALYDGPLSLADLMSTISDDAELAFLSACQTAMGDENTPEESAHLAAGMLAVGFKGVVATMWSIMDEDAPVVVDAYYKKLIELRNSGAVGRGQTGAAYALHEAVAKLRAKVGEGKFGRWAPFVHFGA
ncbi:unnamed protein product, partial [Peniophora sp. CBMAI 1063]